MKALSENPLFENRMICVKVGGLSRNTATSSAPRNNCNIIIIIIIVTTSRVCVAGDCTGVESKLEFQFNNIKVIKATFTSGGFEKPYKVYKLSTFPLVVNIQAKYHNQSLSLNSINCHS